MKKPLFGHKFVGLSLSLCVTHIMENEISLKDIHSIIAATRFSDEQELEEVLNSYTQWYWRKYPEHAKAIARKLYHEGKIIQPRLEGIDAHSIAHCIWVQIQVEE